MKNGQKLLKDLTQDLQERQVDRHIINRKAVVNQDLIIPARIILEVQETEVFQDLIILGADLLELVQEDQVPITDLAVLQEADPEEDYRFSVEYIKR